MKMAIDDDAFEAAVAKIQQEVFSDVRRAFGDVGFERWRKTRYHGRMHDADSFARIRGVCGIVGCTNARSGGPATEGSRPDREVRRSRPL